MPGWLPSLFTSSALGRECGAGKAEETLVFLDVDGVLNVGVRIEGEAPINLTDANVERAVQLQGQQNLHAERILAALQREPGHGEGSTYAKFASSAPLDVSEVLVGRLAQLLRVAGDGCTVVLSSSWRKPQHRKRAKRLEERVAAHLGAPFVFRECTALRSEPGAQDRLESIGQYLAELARSRAARPAANLRILVLEDFCITPLRGLVCQKASSPDKDPSEVLTVNSIEDAERFLEARAARAAKNVQVKVVHTYDNWTSPDGLFVEVGCGLSMPHHCAALRFLGGGCEHCARGAEGGGEELQCCRQALKSDLAGAQDNLCIQGQA